MTKSMPFYPDLKQLATGVNYPIVAEVEVNLIRLLPNRLGVTRSLISGSGTVTDDVSGPERTRLDLNLSGLTIPDGSGAKIIFKIPATQAALFMPNLPVGTTIEHFAVTAGNTLCQDILHNPVLSTDRKQVSVTCLRVSGFTFAVPFNLGMIFPDTDNNAYSLPVFFDPKIKNDG